MVIFVEMLDKFEKAVIENTKKENPFVLDEKEMNYNDARNILIGHIAVQLGIFELNPFP